MTVERHTPSCPCCGARDGDPPVVEFGKVGRHNCKIDRRNLALSLRGVQYAGVAEVGAGHEWQCMECGHAWETICGFLEVETIQGGGQ